MTSKCKSSSRLTSSGFMFKLTSVGIMAFALVLLTAPGVLAQTNVDFFCTLGGSSACTGTVVHSGSNVSSTGITVFNDSGPFSSTVPFTLAFDTATGVVSIDGTGIYLGMNLIGTILSPGMISGGPTSGFSFVALWPTLPASVQTQLGSATGIDTGFVIFLNKTGAPQSVDVVIAPMAPTPEPASMFLMGTGLLALGGLLRKRRRTATA